MHLLGCVRGPAGARPRGPVLAHPLERRAACSAAFSRAAESVSGFLFCSVPMPAPNCCNYPTFTLYDVSNCPSQECRCDFYKRPARDVMEQKARPHDPSGSNVQSTWLSRHRLKCPPGDPHLPCGGTSGRQRPVPWFGAPPAPPPSWAGAAACRRRRQPLVGPGTRGGLHPQKSPRAEGSWGSTGRGRGLCPAGLAFVPVFWLPVGLL